MHDDLYQFLLEARSKKRVPAYAKSAFHEMLLMQFTLSEIEESCRLFGLGRPTIPKRISLKKIRRLNRSLGRPITDKEIPDYYRYAFFNYTSLTEQFRSAIEKGIQNAE